MPKPYGVVYLDFCTVSGKGYVGQTTGELKKRWYYKAYYAKRGVKEQGCRALYAAIRKYGENAFRTFTLAIAKDKEELDSLEIHFIKTLDTLTPNGYNLQEGGHSGKATLETRLKQSVSLLGRTFSQETLDRMRAAKEGRSLPAAHCLAMSAASKGKPKSASHRANMQKPKTAAHRQAMSAAAKKRKAAGS